jgi:hypothetical protein
MKSSRPNLTQLLTVSTIALLCFCAGYLMPHSSAALAQSPHPTPSFIDDVPGGGHGGGTALVTFATADRSRLLTASKSGWLCSKSDHCMVTFAFRTSRQGDPKPRPFTCSMVNCFAFEYTEPGYTYSTVDPYSGNDRETVKNVQITGMFQLQPTK